MNGQEKKNISSPKNSHKACGKVYLKKESDVIPTSDLKKQTT